MMKPQKIIVDGYNVIHADDELKRQAKLDLDRSRRGLVDRLKTYLEDKTLHVTVVFDGRGGLTDAESVLPSKLQLLFSSHNQTADELILETLRDVVNPREYIVVTSDAFDIGKAARALGAQVVSAKAFLERICRGTVGSEQSPEEKPAPTENDTAFWLDVFSHGGPEKEPPPNKSHSGD